ncbi:alpha-ketoglutarate decarboxylase [Antarcticibacterium sp. 1MA-6-2]|uniref:alpha-ketoglutarate decarboxylase n=1 Tax=Antarcticibacterium sp. 1MA-6-2 TaxID=2908210 RepID=UPI001F2D7144|nr:alpha-ketoglutarate decarboxylase [Antarcticibacterium sp. 1MA-6-2]UJH90504.1 alpha-ketoglutarate decarboxylase [Antarcticibacterium sp. 1MA-6-2]
MTKALNFINPKVFFLLLFLIISNSQIKAQGIEKNPQNPSNFWDQVRLGGSLGLSFGNGNFTGALAPSAVYDFNSYFSAGVGISGAYASQRNYKATSFGGSVIGMFRPIQAIQLSAEYEQLNINTRYEFDGGSMKEQSWVPALFVGLGYNAGLSCYRGSL